MGGGQLAPPMSLLSNVKVCIRLHMNAAFSDSLADTPGQSVD